MTYIQSIKKRLCALYDNVFKGMSQRRVVRVLRQRRVLPLVILGLGVVGLMSLLALRPENNYRGARERVWTVRAQEVNPTTMNIRITRFGELLPRREIELRALVAGEVISTTSALEEGARVEKGGTLLHIDPFQYENALSDARARLAGGMAMLTERKASFENSKAEYIRAQALLKRGNVAQKFADDRRTENVIAEARLAQQQAVVAQLEVRVRRATRDLKNTHVIASFDAYVNRVAAREGRVVNLNDRLVTLTDATQFEVRFNLSDTDYGRLLSRKSNIIGRETEIIWSVGDTKLRLKAEIERVGARISQSTRGVDVFARITSSVPQALRAGAFVQVILNGQAFENVIELDKSALYGERLIYVIEDGRLIARQIKIHAETDETIFIRDNIKKGEKILITRFNEAAPNVAVKIIEETTP